MKGVGLGGMEQAGRAAPHGLASARAISPSRRPRRGRTDGPGMLHLA